MRLTCICEFFLSQSRVQLKGKSEICQYTCKSVIFNQDITALYVSVRYGQFFVTVSILLTMKVGQACEEKYC